jgi:hypothetical protein
MSSGDDKKVRRLPELSFGGTSFEDCRQQAIADQLEKARAAAAASEELIVDLGAARRALHAAKRRLIRREQSLQVNSDLVPVVHNADEETRTDHQALLREVLEEARKDRIVFDIIIAIASSHRIRNTPDLSLSSRMQLAERLGLPLKEVHNALERLRTLRQRVAERLGINIKG